MLVGHVPHIERLLCLLIEGNAEGTTAFPVQGIVALEHMGDRWLERWRIQG
jgi:phosphohistidine phosphatase SixA